MLYPQSKDSLLKQETFQNPTSVYRGAPFWAWNCKLDQEALFTQIDQLQQMGMGGFHIHSRSGLDTEYLGEEFMALVKACQEKAKENQMLCWLYDEDRWPSGAAGGLVTKEQRYRSRFLVFTPYTKSIDRNASADYSSSARAARQGDGTLLGRYEILLDHGYLAHYRKLGDQESPQKAAKVWYAYLEVAGDSPWFNNQAYVNTLDKKAIERFLEITHEAYYHTLGSEFGKSVPAIFTDEPQFSHKQHLGYADEEQDIIIPFTDDFPSTYVEIYGEDILSKLPELFWELPDGMISTTRYRYHDHLCERFASAFADTVGDWCTQHNIMLTGHMMSEPTLFSQTCALGEAMRSYRSFHLPGIDMLCDDREFTTAKQAQSAAHQYGRPGVLSELYGVTNWDFDFRGHKLQGDWQAALGVTVRVHHLTWVSMGGEAKRDYPASIGYQSPWYKEYPLIEDHFARLNTALTRGTPRIKVGVIHPIESYWLYFGPGEQTGTKRDELEANFANITNWLLFGLIDYHYISESLLPSLSEIQEASVLNVGEMAYDVILVPGCETLRTTTLERLEAFKKAGGTVLFIGEPAPYVDAIKSDRAKTLAKKSITLPFSQSRILEVLDDYRDLDIRTSAGKRSSDLIYQMREDHDKRWIFICHGSKPLNPDIPGIETLQIRIKGNWKPTQYDTLTGKIHPLPGILNGGYTYISRQLALHDSLLLCLEPGTPETPAVLPPKKSSEQVIQWNEAVPVTLSEPNVLVLDMAAYSFDDGPWQPREEILRIDNAFRTRLGYPLRMEALAQPWTHQTKEAAEHVLHLKFVVESEIEIDSPYLALENAEATEVLVNGVPVPSHVDGWFVDQCIQKIKLPSLPKGTSEILLHIPFHSKTNVEWCYLLGDFGVIVEGSHGKIIEPVRQLYFGDWTTQGLPFYAGNVTYHCDFSAGGYLHLEATHFRSPLLSVSLEGEQKGKIAFAPYQADIGNVNEGAYRLDITAFGNRINAFGTLHNCDTSATWCGPNAWRTTGSSWSYEYQFRPMGVLVSPKLHISCI